MSLIRPIKDSPHGSQGNITQDFDGAFPAERPGWLQKGNPARGKRISFPNAVYRKDLHLAIDYSAALETSVYACHAGVIVNQGRDDSSGGAWFVQQRIWTGTRFSVYAFYYHLAAGSMKFKIGHRVDGGDVIALSGNTGWSTAPHLHFEMLRLPNTTSFNDWYRNGLRYDPQPFINGNIDLRDIV